MSKQSFGKILVCSLLLSLVAITVTEAKDISRLRTELAGPAIAGVEPSGHANWRALDTGEERISVEVEDVNLPDGSTLGVLTDCGGVAPLGLMVVINQKSELELDERVVGDMVPTCLAGNSVTITAIDPLLGLILLGTF